MGDWRETLKEIRQQLVAQEAARKRLATEAAKQGYLPDGRTRQQTPEPVKPPARPATGRVPAPPAPVAPLKAPVRMARGTPPAPATAAQGLTRRSPAPATRQTLPVVPQAARAEASPAAQVQLRMTGRFRGRHPLPGPPSGSSSRRINIGIDFGTSTTKVCARPALGYGEDVTSHALNLDRSQSGEQAFLCPSVVGTQDGRLYFGFEAERRRSAGATVFDHLKVCVACQAEQKGRSLPGCPSVNRERRSCDGIFRFTRGDEPYGITARELATLFLAWVMRASRDPLPYELTGPEPAEFTYNIGVPLDQLQQSSALRDSYRKMTFDAWCLSSAVDQGLPLDRGLAWLEQLRSRELPDLRESKVQLCPELGAALVAFVASPTVRAGMYGLVDVGAWTTEVSFCNLTRSSDQPTVSFYSGATFRIGGTDVDERALRALYELWNLPLPLGPDPAVRACVREIRGQRENGTFGTKTLPIDKKFTRLPTLSTLQFPRDCVGERIRDGFRQAIVAAGEKDRLQSSWEGFPIYVTGGGRRETALWERLADATLVASGVSPLPPNEDVRSLPAAIADRFVIAAGLAIPLPLWHEAHLPHEVEPYRAPSAKRLPSSEELGYVEP